MPDVELSVVPRAATNAVGPYAGGRLRVRVTRPPSDGEANRAVVRLVAAALGVAPSHVELIAGARARHKRVRISGLDAGELERRLRAISLD